MKKALRYIFLVIVLIVVASLNKVMSLDGNNGSAGGTLGSSCTDGWCIANGNYGVRFSIVDSNGVVKGRAINIMISYSNINMEKLGTKNRFNSSYDGYSVDEYLIDDLNDNIKNLLSGLKMIEVTTSNYGTTVDSIIKQWTNKSSAFATIKSIIGANVSSADYLIVEPLTVIYHSDGGSYYYGTAKELTNHIANNLKPGEVGYSSRNWIYERLGKAMYSEELELGGLSKVQSVTINSSLKNTKDETDLNNNETYWNTNACGVAIYSLTNLANQCKIGINNNSETKYNWITYDSTNNQYVPVSEGCCYNYSQYGISKADVEKYYPQCFEEPTCAGSNKKNPDQCSLNRTATSADNKPTSDVTNCLASNKYYGGVIDSDKRILYGCYYSDELSLPGYYQDELRVGSHFVWPTDDTLLQFRPTSLLYNVTRKSIATCYAYMVDESTGYHTAYDSKNISIKEDIVDKIRRKIKDNGTITLSQNGSSAGILNYSETNSNFISQDNGNFKVEINGIYRQNSSYEEAYRYYDKSELEYLKNSQVNKLNDDKIVTLYKYPYMFLPVDKNFDIKNNYTYGFNYAIQFTDIKLSGYYSCNNKVSKDIVPSCVCPTGTENAGLDLTNYYVATNHGECNDVGKTAICSILIDEYCNSKTISYKCPNRDLDLTECVRNKIASNSSLISSMAYNQCVYENCNCDGNNCAYKQLCPDPVKLGEDIIYRAVFLNDPFPSIEADKRLPGSNWGGKKSLISGNYAGLVKKYIIDTEKYMYDKEAMYSITLTPSIIRKIKMYNNGKGYDDFNLECQNGGKCYSNFIHEILPGYDSDIVKGTCGVINGKQSFYNNFDSCRQNSFNS